ncbi:hypothetical protein ABZP36_005869 [Zizania latifolia]
MEFIAEELYVGTPKENSEMSEDVPDVQTDDSEGDRADGEGDREAYQGYLDKVSKPGAVGIALSAVIVPAVLVFHHLRQKQVRASTNADAPAEQAEQIVETLSCSGSSEPVTFV